MAYHGVKPVNWRIGADAAIAPVIKWGYFNLIQAANIPPSIIFMKNKLKENWVFRVNRLFKHTINKLLIL